MNFLLWIKKKIFKILSDKLNEKLLEGVKYERNTLEFMSDVKLKTNFLRKKKASIPNILLTWIIFVNNN